MKKGGRYQNYQAIFADRLATTLPRLALINPT